MREKNGLNELKGNFGVIRSIIKTKSHKQNRIIAFHRELEKKHT